MLLKTYSYYQKYFVDILLYKLDAFNVTVTRMQNYTHQIAVYVIVNLHCDTCNYIFSFFGNKFFVLKILLSRIKNFI